MGSGVSRCRKCTNRELIERDARLVAAELEAPWSRVVWHAYVDSQCAADGGNPNLRKQINHAAVFFRLLGQTFPSQQDITAKKLAQKMDSRFLRRHLVASRFVITHLGLEAFSEEREHAAEHRRIDELLMRGNDQPYGALLASYAKHLAAERVAVRTSRLYLSAASAFCSRAGVDSGLAWPEEQLIRYLRTSPGQAANLGRFVTYCRAILHWDVRMPSRARWDVASISAEQSVRALREAMKTAAKSSASKSSRLKALAQVLSLALGVPANRLLRERKEGRVSVHSDGGIEITANAVIAPNSSLYEFARRWPIDADIRD